MIGPNHGNTYDGDDRTPRRVKGSSKDGGEYLSASGKTRDIKRDAHAFITSQGAYGATAAEVAKHLAGPHHGQVSSALSTMHEDGYLARLAERRQKFEVYVHPDSVAGRETREHASAVRRRREGALLKAASRVESDPNPVNALHLVDAVTEFLGKRKP